MNAIYVLHINGAINFKKRLYRFVASSNGPADTIIIQIKLEQSSIPAPLL